MGRSGDWKQKKIFGGALTEHQQEKCLESKALASTVEISSGVMNFKIFQRPTHHILLCLRSFSQK